MKGWGAALLLALTASSASAETSALNRLTLRSQLSGWEAVGRLDMAGEGSCTGVLISDRLVLTAAHCLVGSQAKGTVDHVTFRAGLQDGEAVAEITAGRAVIHPGYTPGAAITHAQIAADVALIELSAPIPSAYAPPFSVIDTPPAGTAVSVVSYGQGRSEAPSRQAACQVGARDPQLIVFNCDVTFGSSGAPLFSTSGRRAQIVSLVSSGAGGVAFGMALPGAVATLKSALRSGAGVFPAANLTARRITVGGGSTTTTAGGARFVRP